MSSFFWPIKIYFRNLSLSPLAPHHFNGVAGKLVTVHFYSYFTSSKGSALKE
jgi:hypothetical protein